MAERTTAAQRVKMQNVAEREVQRYAGDHFLWHKHIHNVELDPMQVLKCIEMDQNPNTIDFSCRRTGKTAIKELYNLKSLATKADQELGIVAPREAQSLTNLGYMLDAIRRSEILDGHLAYKAGRKRISDTTFEFQNRSIAQAYGIMAQVDGGDMTMASMEEVDDMPADRLYSRFLLMMGSSRRLGASADSENNPETRITGVFKGADTLTDLIESGKYHCLPTVDCHLGIELGILNEGFILDMRDQLSPEEYMRQLLCKNTSSKNLIWEKKLRKALTTGLRANLELADPIMGGVYRRRGFVSFGYDASGHGENPNSSRHALVVSEQIGNFITFPFCRVWPAGADDMVVKRDLRELWRYFMPDEAYGDAYGVGMLTQLNDELHQEGLTSINRQTIGGGQSTASTWSEWAFKPIRFEGMVKHQMAQNLRSAFHNEMVALPYIDHEEAGKDSAVDDMRLLQKQLTNIKELPTRASYSSYKMVRREIGDDLFDAAMASVHGLVTRGVAPHSSVVSSHFVGRDQLLPGVKPMRLPSQM